jgi:hypothetical protein
VVYKQLPIKQVAVSSLRLDLQNYRLADRPGNDDVALLALFAAEKTLDLARLILRNGYFDNEIPVVFEEDGDYVVLEGNRRVSALKALLDPSIVPPHETEIRRLLVRHDQEAADLPAKIRVMISPDRDTVTAHVLRLHTGQSKKAWDVDQQANFYYALYESGIDIAEIRNLYPKTVPRMIQMGAVRRFLNGVRHLDEALAEFVAKELPMTAFEYAYRRSGIAAAVGINFTDGGVLLPTTKPPQKIGETISTGQRKALVCLLEGFRGHAGQPRYSSRSPEFKKSSQELQDLVAILESLANGATPLATGFGALPGGGSPTGPAGLGAGGGTADGDAASGSASGSSSAGAGVGATGSPAGGGDSTSNGSGSRGPNSPDTKDKLQFGSLRYHDVVSVNLERRYIELRSISLSTYPLSAAMLMRSVLETTIKQRLETDSRPSGELSKVFPDVVAAYGKEKALKRQIDTISSGKADKPGSIQWFNHVTHDAEASVMASELRAAWDLVVPVLRRLLQ